MEKRIKKNLFNFAWVQGKVINFTKKPPPGSWYCICGKTMRICKIAVKDMLTVMIVRNFFLEKGVCEEGKCCLDFDCPFNKTTRQSMAANYHWTKKQMDNLPADFGVTAGFNKDSDGKLMDFSDLWDGKDPRLIIYQRRKHA